MRELQGEQFNNTLQTASIHDYGDVVQMLLDNGAHINAGGGRCCTALLAASRYGHENVVKILLDNGADVNVACRAEALQTASEWDHENVVKIIAPFVAETAVHLCHTFLGRNHCALDACLVLGRLMIVGLNRCDETAPFKSSQLASAHPLTYWMRATITWPWHQISRGGLRRARNALELLTSPPTSPRYAGPFIRKEMTKEVEILDGEMQSRYDQIHGHDGLCQSRR